jgi:hypothetical protein
MPEAAPIRLIQPAVQGGLPVAAIGWATTGGCPHPCTSREDPCPYGLWFDLVLPDKLQHQTVPNLRLLPMRCVPSLGNGRKLAIGDGRG